MFHHFPSYVFFHCRMFFHLLRSFWAYGASIPADPIVPSQPNESSATNTVVTLALATVAASANLGSVVNLPQSISITRNRWYKPSKKYLEVYQISLNWLDHISVFFYHVFVHHPHLMSIHSTDTGVGLLSASNFSHLPLEKQPGL